MFTLEFDGLQILVSRLEDAPKVVRAALLAKMTDLSRALYDKIVNEKLAGEVLNIRSGALRASIAARISDDGDALSASVGVDGDIPYATIQEYGGRTSAHDIEAAKARALAFVKDGKAIFCKRVRHPGSQIPERSYLRSSLDELSDEIVAQLSDVASETAAGLMEQR